MASTKLEKVSIEDEAFKAAENEAVERYQKLSTMKGSQSVDDIHKKLGKIMWENCGMSRSADKLN
ncbi:MAG: hypothetical protein AAF235_08770, partial [Planctomycetota bacterium]